MFISLQFPNAYCLPAPLSNCPESTTGDFQITVSDGTWWQTHSMKFFMLHSWGLFYMAIIQSLRRSDLQTTKYRVL